MIQKSGASWESSHDERLSDRRHASGRPSVGMRKATFMIFGAHVVLSSKDAAADRAFCRDALGFASVDAGHGWLIFALPPAELAVHPAEEGERHELFFMCDDLKAEIVALEEKG